MTQPPFVNSANPHIQPAPVSARFGEVGHPNYPGQKFLAMTLYYVNGEMTTLFTKEGAEQFLAGFQKEINKFKLTDIGTVGLDGPEQLAKMMEQFKNGQPPKDN